MTEEQYLRLIVNKYSCRIPPLTILAIKRILYPILRKWAGNYLLVTELSGSYAKGTNISLGNDLDLFVSLRSDTPETLKQIYDSLDNWLGQAGYSTKRQNVSIGININGLSVDLTPGKKQPGLTTDHSLYKSKQDTWTKTNIKKHINVVRQSGRQQEIKAIKIWRSLHRLEFPSIYLELTVMDALRRRPVGQIARNTSAVFEYLANEFKEALIVDPANSSNFISDDLSYDEKAAIAIAAQVSLFQKNWNQIIW